MCKVFKLKERDEIKYLPCISVDGLSEAKPDGPKHIMIAEEYQKLLQGFEEIRQEYDVDGPQDIVLVKNYGEFNYKFIIYSPGVTLLTVEEVKIILEHLRKIDSFFLSNNFFLSNKMDASF